MPRANPVPEKQLAICDRLRQLRLSTKLSRVAFAAEIRVYETLLSNVEHGRAPVRFDLAKRVCERFNISQCWLVEGKPPMKPYVAFSPEVEAQIPKRALLSEAYERFLKKDVQRRMVFFQAGEATGIKITFPDPVGPLPVEDFSLAIKRTMDSVLKNIPPTLHADFVHALTQEVVRFETKHLKEIQKFIHQKIEKTEF